MFWLTRDSNCWLFASVIWGIWKLLSYWISNLLTNDFFVSYMTNSRSYIAGNVTFPRLHEISESKMFLTMPILFTCICSHLISHHLRLSVYESVHFILRIFRFILNSLRIRCRDYFSKHLVLINVCPLSNKCIAKVSHPDSYSVYDTYRL